MHDKNLFLAVAGKAPLSRNPKLFRLRDVWRALQSKLIHIHHDSTWPALGRETFKETSPSFATSHLEREWHPTQARLLEEAPEGVRLCFSQGRAVRQQASGKKAHLAVYPNKIMIFPPVLFKPTQNHRHNYFQDQASSTKGSVFVLFCVFLNQPKTHPQ